MRKGWIFSIFAVCLYGIEAMDLCSMETQVGNWTFHRLDLEGDIYFKCTQSSLGKYISSYKLELKYPNEVVDEFGNKGHWEMIEYNRFEVVIHGRKYYAEFYISDTPHYTDCDNSLKGFSKTIKGEDNYCFKAVKDEQKTHVHQSRNFRRHPVENEDNDRMYKIDDSLIERINSDPNILWYATKYAEFEEMTVSQMKLMAGGKSIRNQIKSVEANEELKNKADKLPENFDWRNVDGVNYINPLIRKQIKCGSCYVLASTSMNEARLNIATGGMINVTLSPQDVLNCNPYDNGCGGGSDFVVAGKYAEEFGLVEENCFPYKNNEDPCQPELRDYCKKHYFTNYRYVGGNFRNCSEEAMLLALVNNGPISAHIDATHPFEWYTGGIYHDISSSVNLHPVKYVNHAVLVIGYGVEESTNTKYWIVKNSWGEKWGENGYFRIRRGTNEIGIESAAVESFPIF